MFKNTKNTFNRMVEYYAKGINTDYYSIEYLKIRGAAYTICVKSHCNDLIYRVTKRGKTGELEYSICNLYFKNGVLDIRRYFNTEASNRVELLPNKIVKSITSIHNKIMGEANKIKEVK